MERPNESNKNANPSKSLKYVKFYCPCEKKTTIKCRLQNEIYVGLLMTSLKEAGGYSVTLTVSKRCLRWLTVFLSEQEVN